MAGSKGSRDLHEKKASPEKDDDALQARLRLLDSKLDALKVGEEAESVRRNKSSTAGFANAMRLSSEFIVAILIGAAIGYMIDYFAGTSPWAMIVFFLLGFAAGVVNVLRLAGTISRPSLEEDKASEPSETDRNTK